MQVSSLWSVIVVSVLTESLITACQTEIATGRTSAYDPKSAASVVFCIADSIGQKRVSGFTVYDGSRTEIGSHYFFATDLKNPCRFILTLKNRENRIADLLMNQFDENLQDDISFYAVNDPNEPELIEKIAAALNQAISDSVIYNPAEYPEVKSKVSADDFTTASRLHSKQRKDPAKHDSLVLVNRRLLESAFPDEIAPSHALYVVDGGSTKLPAGTYWFTANQDPSLVKRVSISAGVTTEIVVHRIPSLWLSFQLEDARTNHLFVPRSREQMQQALLWLRRPQSPSDPASIKSFVRRPHVPQEALKEARDVALELLPEITQPFDAPHGITIEEDNALFFEREARLAYSQNVLGVTGEPEDARKIVQLYNPDCHFRERHHWAATIARIQSRFSFSLSDGMLVSLLEHEDSQWAMAAAVQLHLAGLSDGDDTLRHYIANSTELFLATEPAFALLDSASGATLTAMRAHLKRCLEFFKTSDSPGLAYITMPSCLYLLAYGNDEDWRLVSQVPFGCDHIFYLTFLAENPLKPARHIVNLGGAFHHDLARRIGVGFRDRPKYESQRLQHDLFEMLRINASSDSAGQLALRAGMKAWERNNLYCSYYSPSSEVVRKLGGFAPTLSRFEPHPDQAPSLLEKTPWLPRPQYLDTYIDNWLNGHASYLAQLDYVATSRIQDALKRRGNGKDPSADQLYLAQHRIGTTAWSTSLDNFPMGIDRRTYLFIHREGVGNPGGLFGVAELAFDVVENSLEIRIELNQRAHYEGGAIFGQRVDDWSEWPHHRYVVNSGRELIQNVAIRSAEQKLLAEFVDQSDEGTLLFRVKLPESVSPDWYLDVNLEFLNQHKTLTYNLASGENARRVRRQIDQALSALTTRGPDKPLK